MVFEMVSQIHKILCRDIEKYLSNIVFPVCSEGCGQSVYTLKFSIFCIILTRHCNKILSPNIEITQHIEHYVNLLTLFCSTSPLCGSICSLKTCSSGD